MEIKCPGCSQYIDASAKFCPSCGRALTAEGLPTKPTRREACPDGNCVGVIGENGKCRKCGKDKTCFGKNPAKLATIGEKKFMSTRWKVVFSVIAILFFLSFLRNNAPGPSPDRVSETKKRSDNDPVQQALWIERGKSSIRAKLKDPDTAKFRNTFFHLGGKSLPVACGEVNSKNSFGAYGGYQYFISAGAPDLSYLQEEVSDFSETWNQLCVN